MNASLAPARNAERALLGVAAVAVFVAVLRTALRDWTPTFDLALIWLRCLDVFGPDTPLHGPYSRFGWHHPGPMVFYVLAVPLRLMDGRPSGLLVGALLVSLVSVVSLVRLAARCAGGGDRSRSKGGDLIHGPIC